MTRHFNTTMSLYSVNIAVAPSITSSWMRATPSPTPSPTAPSSQRRPSDQHTKLILGVIGAFLGAVAVLFLVIMCLHLCQKKKKSRRDTVNAETMTDQETNVYVQFPSRNVITNCPAAPPDGQAHRRPCTLPLQNTRHTSSAEQAAGLEDGEYEALLPTTASIELQESSAMYEPVCSSADSDEYYEEPTPIRIQMIIANAEEAAKSTTLDGWNIPVELHPAKDGQHAQEKAEERLYENIVIPRKTNPDELYI